MQFKCGVSEAVHKCDEHNGQLELPLTARCYMIHGRMSEREVRQRVADHRKLLRRKGLRPIQIWVPDVRAPGFAEEAHRQSALAAASAFESDDQAFVDAISSLDDDADDE